MRRILGRQGLRRRTNDTGAGIPKINPTYQYALNEYAQTVPPASSNDDGRDLSEFYAEDERASTIAYSDIVAGDGDQSNSSDDSSSGQPLVKTVEPRSGRRKQRTRQNADSSQAIGSTAASNSGRQSHVQPPTVETADGQIPIHRQPRRPLPPYRYAEPIFPDAVYEEWYGDAYVGGPIRYIYPSGYQSMRPRGGPWKLSVVVSLSFTWLSIFVIGYCSDHADQNIAQNEIDDDSLAIETRWCGSRMLYLMWVGCMLITGLSIAYTSIIGYIKMRDFVVANCRSIPTGMAGRSDYYFDLDESRPPQSSGNESSGERSSGHNYQQTLYQSDGQPQFWGDHIYRPTQAAVAVATR